MGMQIRWLSILSITPPCPGNKFPKSLTPINLFDLLANKSPEILAKEEIRIIKKVMRYPYESINRDITRNSEKTSDPIISTSMNKYPKKRNKKLGITNPNIVPSKVLFGLIEGKINLLPKSFPKTKAKISVNTEINNAVKKKLLPDEFAIEKIKDILIRIIINIIHTKMLLSAFILNNSKREYPNMPAKII